MDQVIDYSNGYVFSKTPASGRSCDRHLARSANLSACGRFGDGISGLTSLMSFFIFFLPFVVSGRDECTPKRRPRRGEVRVRS